jgi:hypothetical protein
VIARQVALYPIFISVLKTCRQSLLASPQRACSR